MTDNDKHERYGYLNNRRYSGLLGMTEMEEALWLMEMKSHRLNTTINKLRMCPEEFVAKDNLGLLVGFCQLVYRELMVPDYPNCEFIPGKRLIDIVNERWGTNFAYAKHKWEMSDEEMFPGFFKKEDSNDGCTTD